MKCRVKVGQELAHGGTVLTGGTDVELAVSIAHEVRHLVDEVLPGGETRPIGAEARAAAELQDALDRAQPHERVSLLEQARAEAQRFADGAQSELARLDKLIAAERKAPAKPAKPAAPAPTQAPQEK